MRERDERTLWNTPGSVARRGLPRTMSFSVCRLFRALVLRHEGAILSEMKTRR